MQVQVKLSKYNSEVHLHVLYSYTIHLHKLYSHIRYNSVNAPLKIEN